MNTTVHITRNTSEEHQTAHYLLLDCCDHMLHTTYREARGNHKEMSAVLYPNNWALLTFNKAP